MTSGYQLMQQKNQWPRHQIMDPISTSNL